MTAPRLIAALLLAAGCSALLFPVGCIDQYWVECGPERCSEDEICITRESTIGTAYECAADPCTFSLGCDCAGALCGAPYACGGTEHRTLSCFCPQC